MFSGIELVVTSFVAINRLAALGALPQDVRGVDFRPDDPPTDDWVQQAIGRSGISNKLTASAFATRGDVCRALWDELQKQRINWTTRITIIRMNGK